MPDSTSQVQGLKTCLELELWNHSLKSKTKQTIRSHPLKKHWQKTTKTSFKGTIYHFWNVFVSWCRAEVVLYFPSFFSSLFSMFIFNHVLRSFKNPLSIFSLPASLFLQSLHVWEGVVMALTSPGQRVHTSLTRLPVKAPHAPLLACCRLILSSLLNVICPQNTCPIFWKANQTFRFRWRWGKPLVSYTKQPEGSGNICILTGLLINHISYRFKNHHLPWSVVAMCL